MKKASLTKQYGIPAALMVLSLLLLLLPFLPEPGESEAGWSVAIGRVHPLVVHFPIVLVLIPLLLEGLRRIWQWQFDARLMPFLMTLAIGSALVSVLAGFLLYQSGEYSGDLVNDHLAGGVALALCLNLSGLALYLHWDKLFLTALLLANLLLVYTGHLGGSLTHGTAYLTELLPDWNTEVAPIEQKPLAELNVFDEIVMAVFEAKCLSCHNPQKAKGKLVMSSYEAILKGGESGEALLDSNSLSGSALYHRIALPLEDEDHMPPRGKAQLSEVESQLIAWWIQSGASPEQRVGEQEPRDSIGQALATYLPQIAYRQQVQIQTKRERDELAEELMPVAKQLGLEVEPDPESDSLLFAVSMKLPAMPVTDASLVELLPFGHAISRVSLVSSEITDEGLYTLGQMSALRHLFLAKTCITGSGLPDLAGLQQLETLNLSETFVEDAHALHLLDLPALERVYLFRSNVSLNVIEALQQHRPETKFLPTMGELY